MGTLVQYPAAALLVTLLGCGRLEFDPRFGSDPDGGLDSTVQPPAPDADAGACDPTAPFGAPVPIAELNSNEAEGTLRLMPDELSGYFWRGSPPNQNILLATRPDLATPFTIAPVQGLETGTSELDPTISSDG